MDDVSTASPLTPVQTDNKLEALYITIIVLGHFPRY